MGFRLPRPIQEREQVQNIGIETTPTPRTTMVAPIQTDLGTFVDKQVDVLEAKQRKIDEKNYQFAKADFENKRDRVVGESILSVTSADGENAFKAADVSQKKLRQTLEKELESVPEQYKAEFSQLANAGINRYDTVSLGHQYRQQNIVREKTFKTRSDYLTEQVSQAVYVPEQFNLRRAQLLQVTEMYVRQTMGGDPAIGSEVSPEVADAIAVQKAVANSTALTKTVESLVASGDLFKAKDVRDTYREELTASDKIRVDNLLSKGAKAEKTTQAKLLMEDAMNAFPGDANAQARFIRANAADGDIYRTSAQMHRAEVNFQETEKKRQMQKNFADVQKSIRDSKGRITDDMLRSLDPELHDNAVEYAVRVSRGDTIPRDPRAYNYLYNLYLRQPDRFSEENLAAYQNRLPRADIESFMAKQREVQDPMTTKSTAKDVQDIINRIYLSNEGPMPRMSTSGKEEWLSKQTAYKSLADKVLEDVKAALPERVSKAELRDAFEKEYVARTMKPKEQGFWSSMWDTVTGSQSPIEYETQTNLTEKGYTTGQTRLFQGYNSTIVDQIRQGLKVRRGSDPSDADILKSLKEFERRGVNVR